MSNNDENIKDVTNKSKLTNRTLGLKRWLSFIVTLSMIMSLIILPEIETYAYSGGTGTSSDPYLISSTTDLNALASAVNGGETYSGKYFKMTRNLSYNSSTTNNFTPIGFTGWGIANPENMFSGTFDGGGYYVSGLNIDYYLPDHGVEQVYYYIGLFGIVKNATIKNLGVINSTIKGGWYVGGIVGWAGDTDILNCYGKNNTVQSGRDMVGGIVGKLIKDTGNASIDSCYNSGGSVYAGLSSAGLGAGGIAGNLYGATLMRCYNTSTVQSPTGWGTAGGIVGSATNEPNIMFVYNIGSVSGAAPVGPIVGNGTVHKYSTHLYYLSGCSTEYWGPGTSQTATELQSAANFAGYLKKDKTFINDGYPILTWQKVSTSKSYVYFSWSDLAYTCDGTAKKPTVTVRRSSSTGTEITGVLDEGVDYQITYDGSTTAPKDAGTYALGINLTSTGSQYYYLGTVPTANLKLTATNPSAPVLKAKDGGNKVTLTWSTPDFDGGTPITGYTLQRSLNPDSSFVNLPYSFEASDTTCIDTDVISGTKYYYRVIATNSSNLRSTPSAVAEANPYTVPDIPENMTAEMANRNPNTGNVVLLKWNPPLHDGGNKLKQYNICVYSDEECENLVAEYPPITNMSMGDYQQAITNLESGKTYYFTVAAENDAGIGEAAKASVLTWDVPSAPQNVTIETEKDGNIHVKWDEPRNNGGTDITEYVVSFREKGTEEWQKERGISGTEYIVAGLTLGCKYEFKVAAVTKATEQFENYYGQESDIVEGIAATAPIAPVIGELISKNASIEITSVEVSDNFGDAVNKYSIYVSRKNEDGSFGEYTKLSEIETKTDSSSNILGSGLEICVKKVSKKDALFLT